MKYDRTEWAIVRPDKPPHEWWDGYYCKSWTPMMVEYWTERLSVSCYAMRAEYPDLPESGYHSNQPEETP